MKKIKNTTILQNDGGLLCGLQAGIRERKKTTLHMFPRFSQKIKNCKSNNEDYLTPQRRFGRYMYIRTSRSARDHRLPPWRRWRGTWKTKGFLPAGFGRQIAINWTFDVSGNSYMCDYVCPVICVFRQVTRTYMLIIVSLKSSIIIDCAKGTKEPVRIAGKYQKVKILARILLCTGSSWFAFI